MLRLGTLELLKPYFQASLSGYTDRAMRLLGKEFGAPLTFTGVMLDKMTLHPSVLKRPDFAAQEDEHPVGAQIMGSSAGLMSRAAKNLEAAGYDLIDLNFACPAPKVLRRERGGYLLNQPELVLEIYRRVREAVRCPVLMKLRIGVDASETARENFRRIYEGACEEGIDALVIHGRTVDQKYKGHADWDTVAEVKRRYPRITVIGSGDLMTAEAAVERLRSSGVDGVAIARGVIGNPWIFRELDCLLAGQPMCEPPSVTEQGEVLLKHFDMVTQLYARRKAFLYFRKFAVRYCRRHPRRKAVQLDLMTAKGEKEVRDKIRQWYGVG